MSRTNGHRHRTNRCGCKPWKHGGNEHRSRPEIRDRLDSAEANARILADFDADFRELAK